jgi:curved DNA-binding protein CbpA
MDAAMSTASISTSYKTLQLKPAATRELVEEAYWALIAELKIARVPDHVFSAELARLNSAYEHITSLPPQRAPRSQPVRRRRGLSRRGSRDAGPAANFYDLLQVDEEAVDAVVRVAVRQLVNRHSGAGPDNRALREAAARAHEVLSNPVRRSEYDSRMGIWRGTPEEPKDAAEAIVDAEGHAPGVTLELRQLAVRLQSAASSLVPREQTGGDSVKPAALTDVRAGRHSGEGTEEAAEEGIATVHKEPALSGTGDDRRALDESPSSDLSASVLEDDADALPRTATQSAERSAEVGESAATSRRDDEMLTPEPPASLGFDAGSLPATRAEPDPSATQSEATGAANAARDHQPQLNQYLVRLASLVSGRRHSTVAERVAETERLLTLREELPPVADVEDGAIAPLHATSVEEPDGLAVPTARFVFDAGPMAGMALPILAADNEIEGVEVSMEGADGVRTELRIVRRGDSYVLVHLDGPVACVGGQDMQLPVLVLEDGDTITVGASAAHFVAEHALAT